ncbi:hypothetical protein FSO04_18595 [Paraburkholderia madseniana]|uniref:Uncharacterized protein n=1 Tax=Paraburkholderia madseniana TaxID=2599607 RepID=A0A6N6WD66_9BURK|nr:hypothetical protein [Paraburkholderia madseniana]KAE8758406.1 hypothetical protein FSO04_18595 [Paraburkholderia madseniana]
MAYSCTDFFDDVMRCLVESQAITQAEIPVDDPGSAADLAVEAIVTMNRSGLSSRFVRELLDEVESLGAVAEALGTGAPAFLFYLQAAILNDSCVKAHGADSKLVALVERLPSATIWMKHIQTIAARV